MRRLLDLGLEPEAVARSLGRNLAWVARRSSLTDLSDAWREALSDPEKGLADWPASHLELVARFPAETQDRMLERLDRNSAPALPSLADLRRFTGEYARQLGSAPWKLEDETLVSEAGACDACPKRSACHPDLFSEELPRKAASGKEDRCLDSACWESKANAHLVRREETLRRVHPGLVLYDVEGTGAHRGVLGGRTVRSWDAPLGRKADPGAVPAMVVSGPGVGRLRWILPAKTDSPAHRNGHGNGNGRTPGQSYSHPLGIGHANGASANGHGIEANGATPETLAESVARRRLPYDKRRRQHVIDAVRERLHRLAATEDRHAAERLEGGAVLVGTNLIGRTLALLAMLLGSESWRRDPRDRLSELPDAIAWDTLGDDPDPEPDDHTKSDETDPIRDSIASPIGASLDLRASEFNRNTEADSGSDRNGETIPENHVIPANGTTLDVKCAFQALLAVCWNLQRSAVATLAARCFVSNYDRDNDVQYDNAVMACELLGFDHAALRDQAARTIPYAKAWRDHIRDDWRIGDEPVAMTAMDTTVDPHDTPAHAALVSDDEDGA